jgi:hypothetical protein
VYENNKLGNFHQKHKNMKQANKNSAMETSALFSIFLCGIGSILGSDVSFGVGNARMD